MEVWWRARVRWRDWRCLASLVLRNRAAAARIGSNWLRRPLSTRVAILRHRARASGLDLDALDSSLREFSLVDGGSLLTDGESLVDGESLLEEASRKDGVSTPALSSAGALCRRGLRRRINVAALRASTFSTITGAATRSTTPASNAAIVNEELCVHGAQ